MEPTTSVAAPQTKIEGPVSLLVNAWHMFKANWEIFTKVIALPFIYFIVVEIIAVLLSLLSSRLVASSMLMALVSVVIVLLLYIGGIVISIAQVPALLDSIHHFQIDPSIKQTLGGQYKVGLHYFWWYLLLSIMSMLIIMGSSVLLIIPGIVVCVFIFVSIPALVIDGQKGFHSLTESYALIKGRWWAVFGRMLFLVLAVLVTYLIFLGIFFVINLSVSHLVGSVISLIVGAVLIFVFIVVIHATSSAYLYRLYISLKSTRLPNVATRTFKGWLIGFLCLGVLSVIVMIFLVPFIIFSSLSNARTQAYQNPPYNMNVAPYNLDQAR